ncbi:MAG: hypothetical protein WBM70_08575 [Sulfurovum sp.]|jgi:hypothetical protein|uniref:hypothetical protein n=1 Tax=Sulfurovum sp. TaxID=1969726 RepID=UPI003C756F44
MKILSLALFLVLCLTACSPRIGAGIGGVVVSGDGVSATEIVADTETGIHGSVTMGTDIRL